MQILRRKASLREPFAPEESQVWTRSGEARVWLVYRSLPVPVARRRRNHRCRAALDVTERKRSEGANAHLAAIIAASDDAIYSLSPDGA